MKTINMRSHYVEYCKKLESVENENSVKYVWRSFIRNLYATKQINRTVYITMVKKAFVPSEDSIPDNDLDLITQVLGLSMDGYVLKRSNRKETIGTPHEDLKKALSYLLLKTENAPTEQQCGDLRMIIEVLSRIKNTLDKNNHRNLKAHTAYVLQKENRDVKALMKLIESTESLPNKKGAYSVRTLADLLKQVKDTPVEEQSSILKRSIRLLERIKNNYGGKAFYDLEFISHWLTKIGNSSTYGLKELRYLLKQVEGTPIEDELYDLKMLIDVLERMNRLYTFNTYQVHLPLEEFESKLPKYEELLVLNNELKVMFSEREVLSDLRKAAA